MTSAPEGKPGRRPPTIELKATEIEQPSSPTPADAAAAERPTQAGAPGGAPAAAPRQDAPGTPEGGPEQSTGSTDRLRAYASGAVIGAAVMAAIMAGVWGLLPSRQAAAPGAATPSTVSPSAGPDIAARLDKIQTAIEAQRPEPAPASRLAAAEAQTKSLADSLAALSRRVDDIAAMSQSAAKQADAAQSAAEAAQRASLSASQTAAPKTDIDALAQRIAALQETVKALAATAAQRSPAGDYQAARLAVAAAALREAVESGLSYRAELAAVQSLGVAADAAAALEPFAASGVPSAAALAHDLAGLSPALQRAADATPATTFFGRLEANAQHLVRVTPVEAPAGTDPAAVIARIDADAARADIAAALTDIAALPDAAKPLAADWVEKAKARDAAIAASRQIAAGALAALARPATQ